MAINELHGWLIAYDIAEPRRLARLQRYVKTVAAPVQYSLYLAQETRAGIHAIRDALAARIHPQQDDVRIYQLPKRTNIIHYGKRPLPEGLLLLQADPGRAGWVLTGRGRTACGR